MGEKSENRHGETLTYSRFIIDTGSRYLQLTMELKVFFNKKIVSQHLFMSLFPFVSCSKKCRFLPILTPVGLWWHTSILLVGWSLPPLFYKQCHWILGHLLSRGCQLYIPGVAKLAYEPHVAREPHAALHWLICVRWLPGRQPHQSPYYCPSVPTRDQMLTYTYKPWWSSNRELQLPLQWHVTGNASTKMNTGLCGIKSHLKREKW